MFIEIGCKRNNVLTNTAEVSYKIFKHYNVFFFSQTELNPNHLPIDLLVRVVSLRSPRWLLWPHWLDLLLVWLLS